MGSGVRLWMRPESTIFPVREMAIDETEVRAATVAQQKKVTGPVLRLAKMLEADHGRDIEDVQSLTQTLGLTLSDTTTVDQPHAKGEEMMTRLAPLTGDDFGRAYVTQMVGGHREALQMIDDFLKTAQNEEVRQHLQQVRTKIATHLKEAERLSVGRTERPASSESRDQQPLTSQKGRTRRGGNAGGALRRRRRAFGGEEPGPSNPG